MDLDRVGTLPIRTSIAKSVSETIAQSLISGSQTKTIYKLNLQASSGKSAQFRVDSRIPIATNSAGELVSFFEVGIGIDVSPKVSPSREIALSTSSQVRVRRGPAVNGGLPLIYETPALRYETRVREGETAVLGGFITDAERTALPMLSPLPDNPVVSYLFGKKREQQANFEIVVLLTPHIAGPIIDTTVEIPIVVGNVPPVPVGTSSPAAQSPSLSASKTPASQVRLPAAVVPSPAPVFVDPPSMVSALPEPATPVKPPPVMAASVPSRIVPPAKIMHGTTYTVQVGAFEDSANAEVLVRKLTQKKYDAFVDKVSGTKAAYHVRVGRFPEMKAARDLQKKLQRDGFGTFVTTLE